MDNLNNIDNFFTENIDNSGAGACSYNETAINIDTGYGDGSSYDEVNLNNGKGRRTGRLSIAARAFFNDGYSGSGMASGCNTVLYHLKPKKINYNGQCR